jgi:hypothetical protein
MGTHDWRYYATDEELSIEYKYVTRRDKWKAKIDELILMKVKVDKIRNRCVKRRSQATTPNTDERG